MSTNSAAPGGRRRFQEGGLLGVILLLSLILGWAGGSVRMPKFEQLPDGTRHRVTQPGPDGDPVPVFEQHNKFFNAQNLTQLAKDTSFVAIMAVGMTWVIIAGQIDLSVGAIYALASVCGALVLHRLGPDGSSAPTFWAVTAGILACLGTGTLCGLANGAMIVGLRVHPFIITLGTMAVFRGIAFVATQGQSIGGFPQAFRDGIKWETAGGLTLVPLAVTVLITIAGGIFLSRVAAGRRIYAVGGNELASRYSGVGVNRVKLGVFLASGTAAGIAALLSLGYYGAATSGDGQGYELSVIAAAVIGGASLTGGRGSALGALLGALIIQLIQSGIVILGIDQNYSQILIGSVVILAVLLDQLTARRIASAKQRR